MEWNLKWGHELGTLLEIWESTGIKPKGLHERPLLQEDLHDIWQAYSMLHACRSAGFSGPNPISMTEIQAYLSVIQENDTEERMRLLTFIKMLDSMYLGHAYDESKKKSLINPKTPMKKTR
jgi:hypothetical protein